MAEISQTNQKHVKIVDQTFRPDASMVRGYVPTRVAWDNYNYEMVWATHMDILNGNRKDDKPAYGILIESSEILPQVYQAVLQNITALRQKYKNIFTWHKPCLNADPDFFKQIPAYGSWMPTQYGGGLGKDIPVKSKAFSTITSSKTMCAGHQLRQILSKQIEGSADCFGSFFNNPITTSWEGIAPYRFHLVIENSAEPNYFTEKLLNCFSCETIPVYWGCTNLAKFGFDMRGIVPVEEFIESVKRGTAISDFTSLDAYNSRLEAVQKNRIAVREYERPLEDIIVERYF